MATTRTMQMLNEFPKPTIALVHGACFGGGCGLVCCTDVALATPAAIFGLTEVRVGVAPTPISTHMVHAMGLRHTRRYALTGERFGAEEALRIGLVHEVVPADRLETRLAEILDAVFLSAPGAIAVTKASFLAANGLTLDESSMALLAHESWMQRASAEGREGLEAFQAKRKPDWYRAAEA
jgi:methylglutaconyl-CoA hydratase